MFGIFPLLFFTFLSPTHSFLISHTIGLITETAELLSRNPINFTEKIDNEVIIENYVKSFAKITRPRGKLKRSIDPEPNPIYVFDSFANDEKLHDKLAVDTILFERFNGIERIKYVAILETNQLRSKTGDSIVIYRIKANEPREILDLPSPGAVRLEFFQKYGSNYLIVGNRQLTNAYNGSVVYHFTAEEKLEFVQSLFTPKAIDVTVWEHINEVFMAIVEEYNATEYNRVRTPIYRWFGSHFDEVDSLVTWNPRHVEAIKVASRLYLAVANHEDDYGQTDVFSEVFLYDVNRDKFDSCQKILTHGVNDLKYFSLRNGEDVEGFLAVANGFTYDKSGNPDYNTTSVIYKYVDGYFLPFQTFMFDQLLKWIPIQGHNGEFILIATTRNSPPKIFQYNGWQFLEIDARMPRIDVDTTTLRAHRHNNNVYMIISNPSDFNDYAHVQKLHFVYSNVMNEMLEQLQTSNGQMTAGLTDVKIRKLAEMYDAQRNQIIDAYEIKRIEQNGNKLIYSEHEIKQITKNLNEMNVALTTMENRLHSEVTIYKRDETIDNLTITCSNVEYCTLKNVKVKSINGNLIDQFYAQTIDLDVNQQIDTLTLNHAEISSNFEVKMINGHLTDTLIHRDDVELIETLIVDGNVEFGKVLIDGTIDTVKIDVENVLLVDEPQEFSVPLTLESITVRKLNSPKMNEIVYDDQINRYLTAGQRSEKFFDTLNVRMLNVSGFINNIDIGEIDRWGLKTSGDQVINAPWTIGNLQTAHVSAEELSGKNIPNDFILINGSKKFTIHDDVEFLHDVYARNLVVRRHVNEIKVNKKLRPDLLLSNDTETQFITGSKTFENVELRQLLKLHGQIRSRNIERMNPMIYDGEDLTLDGDFVIGNDVTVEKLITCENIQITHDKTFNVERLFSHGLTLNDSLLEAKTITFDHGIHVQRLRTNSINKIAPSDWFVIGMKDIQYVEGIVSAPGNLTIANGGTYTMKVNDVDLFDLMKNTLTYDGLQFITAHHVIEQGEIFSLECKNAWFGGHDITQLMYDVANDKLENLAKFRKNINVANISIKNIRGNPFNSDMRSEQLPKTLNVKNLIVNASSINNMSMAEIKDGISNRFIDVIGMEIENLIVTDNLTINNFQYENQLINLVRLDENITFEEINFESEIICEHINVAKLSRMDLSTVIWNNNDQHFVELSVDNLTIDGNLLTENISTVNLNDLTRLLDTTAKNVKIFGTITFPNDPKITTLNDRNVIDVIENVWIVSATDPELIGVITFNNVMKIDGDIRVNRFNGKNVTWLNGNYLSKTKNQSIGNVDGVAFRDVTFGGVTVGEIGVKGLIGGVKWSDLTRWSWKYGDDQIVYGDVRFGNVTVIEDLQINGYVNDLNMAEDLLRFATPNTNITGNKFIDNLIVNNLIMAGNSKINDVNVNEWIDSSITNDRAYALIDVEKFIVYGNVTIGDIGVEHRVNDLEINPRTVLEQNSSRTGPLTGYKMFSGPVKIHNMVVKWFLNGVNMDSLLENTLFKTSKFAIIDSKNTFEQNIHVQHAFVNALFDVEIDNGKIDTTNASLYCMNEEYEELLTQTDVILRSVKGQAYYLKYLKLMKYQFNIHKYIVPIRFGARNFTNFAVLSRVNATESIYFYKFDGEELRKDLSLNKIQPKRAVSFLKAVEIDGMEMLYMEEETNRRLDSLESQDVKEKDEKKPYKAILLNLSPNETHAIFTTFENVGTKDVLSTSDSCLLISYVSQQYIDVMCLWTDYFGSKFIPRQRIETSRPLIIKQMDILGVSYLFVMTKHDGGSVNDTRVTIYRRNTYEYELAQQLQVTKITSLDVIGANSQNYLSIASGHLHGVIYPGLVHIYRFNPFTLKFEAWQRFPVPSPSTLMFSRLPTNELALYLLHESATEPFTVYMYRGISGFERYITATSVMPRGRDMKVFTNDLGEYFVVVNDDDRAWMLKGVFNGVRV